jgi:hypothetical protein
LSKESEVNSCSACVYICSFIACAEIINYLVEIGAGVSGMELFTVGCVVATGTTGATAGVVVTSGIGVAVGA